jgi:hypothetical protein
MAFAPRRIQLAAKLLETRSSVGETQSIVTTHPRILPDLLPNEALFVCRRRDGRTVVDPFTETGPWFRHHTIKEGLEDPVETVTKVSDRILRGDFDV